MNTATPAPGKLQRRRLIAASSLAAGALVLPTAMKNALAQTAPWPSKPIRIIVAFAAGGLTDSYARLYAEQLTARFGIQAIVENKPGAGAIIAIDAVAKSPADGYTLLMTTPRKTLPIWAATRRARTRKWWPTRPTATKAQRSSPSTTVANRQCGWTWRAGNCRWQLAVTSHLPPCSHAASRP